MLSNHAMSSSPFDRSTHMPTTMWIPAGNDDNQQYLHTPIPTNSGRLSEPMNDSSPELELMGFDLIAKIGEGGFAKVYLAQQTELSNRLVVLKISRERRSESDVLAQLLHTNIVPVYSVHHYGDREITCMPYFGATTLADILREVRTTGLPHSGKYLVETLQEHRSTRKSSLSGKSSCSAKPASLSPVEPDLAEPADRVSAEPRTRLILDKLEEWSYEEAVLWLVSQLADGLEHAHERGIIHRDLKPANVLLTDEGQPMLLDFNLAEDMKITEPPDASRLGGTMAYMSPEQMDAFEGKHYEVDRRSDIYSLGIILFELLTGQFPFPFHQGAVPEILKKMHHDRRQGPPNLIGANPAITPAIQAIVQKCLQPDPDKRYQTAGQLEEDIRQQLERKPLLHTPEPSLSERCLKWRARHPRLASLTSVLCLSAVLVAALAAAVSHRGEQLKQYRALEQYTEFEAGYHSIQYLLTGTSDSAADAENVLKAGHALLQPYQVAADPEWRTRPGVVYLPGEKQRQLSQRMAAVFLLMSQATAIQSKQSPDGTQRRSNLAKAMDYSDKSEALGAARHMPKAFYTQRARLYGMLGDREQSDRFRNKANQVRLANDQDSFHWAHHLVLHGQPGKALALLEELTDDNPNNALAWYLKGRCHRKLKQCGDAVTSFTMCIALRPNTVSAYFQRGLIYLRRLDYDNAEADFSRVIQLEAGNANAYFNRALAWRGLNRPQRAVDDLTKAVQLNIPHSRIYFLRARILDQMGNEELADKDRATGLKTTPAEEKSWIARGIAKLASDREGALADFRAALDLNPASRAALVNIAFVLSSMEGRNDEKLAAFNQLVKHHPNFLRGRVVRALFLAKIGRRQAALDEAKECLKQSRSPQTHYRVAEIYAATSKYEAKDGVEAVRHLKTALLQGYGANQVHRDPQFAPIRNTAQFQQMLAAIRLLKQQ